MNLLSKCTDNEINLIKQAGVIIENKDYTEDEVKQFGNQMEEYIMSHSSKNNDIDKLQNNFSRIFRIIYG